MAKKPWSFSPTFSTEVVENMWKEGTVELKLLQRLLEESSSLNIEQSRLARIAIYENEFSAPRTIDISANDQLELIDLLGTQVYQLAKEKGSIIPYTVIKEVVENLLHARCQGVVVTILDGGQVIRVADQGPGIPDKEKAFQPGFTTATPEMRRYIRGVGSGLPLIKQLLTSLGGQIFIEDNLKRGTVVTLFAPRDKRGSNGVEKGLSLRQKKILFLLAEVGPSGPSRLAQELNASLSTIYRDLKCLEKEGLIVIDENGKRNLSDIGIEFLDQI